MEPINKKLGFRQVSIAKENNALTFNLLELGKQIKFKLETNGNIIPIAPIKPLNISELRAKAIFNDLNESHPFISDLFNMPNWNIKNIAIKMNENWKMTELQKRVEKAVGTNGEEARRPEKK